MFNPFTEMEKYNESDLESMTLEELLAAQRSVLFPHEREIFDAGGSIFIKDGDGRAEFLDATDMLICERQ